MFLTSKEFSILWLLSSVTNKGQSMDRTMAFMRVREQRKRNNIASMCLNYLSSHTQGVKCKKKHDRIPTPPVPLVEMTHFLKQSR